MVTLAKMGVLLRMGTPQRVLVAFLVANHEVLNRKFVFGVM